MFSDEGENLHPRLYNDIPATQQLEENVVVVTLDEDHDWAQTYLDDDDVSVHVNPKHIHLTPGVY